MRIPDQSIIVDNEDMAQLLALHFRDLQHNVEICFNGDSGLEHIENSQYHLIILDLILPGRDGLSIFCLIRAKHNYTRILTLTAKASEFDRALGLETQRGKTKRL